MVAHEKKAFYKFFLIYFLSIASLILIAGFFYFKQMKNQYLKNEEFLMINFAKDLKMGKDVSSYDKKEYKYSIVSKTIPEFNMNNFIYENKEFIKYIPVPNENRYLEIIKYSKAFENKIFDLQIKIHLIQLILLFLFAYISYILSKNALKPLQESISTLDKFAKDLIHDLNTPVTAINLNMKILQKDENFNENKALQRLNKSVHTISELHGNLTILLEQKTFQTYEVNLFDLIQEVVLIEKQIYSNIDFKIDDDSLLVKTNPNAMKQIMQNIISNACKYNSKNGFVKIYEKNSNLYIQDSGKGISHADKIFDRSFSDENSSGIGLDIVKRLAMAMDIKISVQSNTKGSTFILSFS